MAPSSGPLLDNATEGMLINSTDITENFTNKTDGTMHEIRSPLDFYVGMIMACAAASLTGTSFVITKKALLRLAKHSVRAADGGHGYLREPLWWFGFMVNAAGETCNFAAYSFAPATIVGPLNGLSVIISALLAAKFLSENLNLIGKIGCFLALIGATGLVVHAPRTTDASDLESISNYVNSIIFVVYICICIVFVAFMLIYMAPRYGRRWIFVYLGVCSVVGSLTVMNAKIFGLAIRELLNGNQEAWSNYLTYVSFFALLVCIVMQLKFFNMALDAFNTPIVICIYYVMFSTAVITSSCILLREFANLDRKDIIGLSCGFLTVVAGVFQLNAFRHITLSLSDISTRKDDVNLNDKNAASDETANAHCLTPGCKQPCENCGFVSNSKVV